MNVYTFRFLKKQGEAGGEAFLHRISLMYNSAYF